MKHSSSPFRFLALVLGGWTCLRFTMLASMWWEEPPNVLFSQEPGRQQILASRGGKPPFMKEAGRFILLAPGNHENRARISAQLPAMAFPPALIFVPIMARPDLSSADIRQDEPGFLSDVSTEAPPVFALPAPFLPSDGRKRWQSSAWLFIRSGKNANLAPGGILGGSQAGIRFGYRVNKDIDRPLVVSGRFYAPLGTLAGAEIAGGIDWKPFTSLPLHVLAERRQALGKEGRTAFSLTIHGGTGGKVVGPIRYEAYGQAGIVGARSRDLFADGAVRFSIPAGPAQVGFGLWGAAQPGAARVDIGPQASFRLPVKGVNMVVMADWRVRITGNASPRSGPSLTLATDF